MSQDTHLFSVRRPRETLGGLNYNAGAFTGIPQPASALKRSNSSSGIENSKPNGATHGRSQSSSRMSLAPGRPPQPSFQRSSSGNNLAEMGRSTVQRTSNVGRMSYAPNALQTPRPQGNLGISQSVQRRSSVYSRPSVGGPNMQQQSFFVQAPVPAGVPQDKRRLRDRHVQNQIGAELEDYLSNKGFQMEMKHPLRPDTLRSPTQKDFTMIFQWLYKKIDPAYIFQKGIDYEVPPILKQLRYPYEKSITKSQLTAVGGQNWSTLLGMLHWLMQLATMMERYSEDRYDYACIEEGVDVTGDRIIFRFLSSAYQDWLSCPPGEDEDDDEGDRILLPHVERMAAEFESGGAQYAEELKVLEAENEALKRKIEEAERDMPNLEQLDETIKMLESDDVKFTTWNTNVVEKLKKHAERNERINKEIEDYEKQLEEVTREKAELQRAVDKQGIAVTDIDRMNGERERLQNGVTAARERLEELSQRIKEKESGAEEKLQQLEGLVRQFNSLCYDVGLRGEEFDLVININEAPFSSSQMGNSQQHGGDRLLAEGETGYHPSKILSLDLRGLIKGEINSLRKEINKRRNDSKDKDEENRRLLFETSAAIDDKKQEVEALEHRVRSAEEEFENTKEVTTKQKHESDLQIERLEKELAKMRAGMNDSVQLMEQREMNTNIEFEQLTLKANALRHELHSEVERILSDIVKFKMHIQSSLEGYEGFVFDEVEAELGESEESEVPADEPADDENKE